MPRIFKICVKIIKYHVIAISIRNSTLVDSRALLLSAARGWRKLEVLFECFSLCQQKIKTMRDNLEFSHFFCRLLLCHSTFLSSCSFHLRHNAKRKQPSEQCTTKWALSNVKRKKVYDIIRHCSVFTTHTTTVIEWINLIG